ncbi:hypothetical protein BD770DRAFT_334676, partial [Pilaira anomala]
ESSSHFLFICRSKLEVWKHIWYTYITSSSSSFFLDNLIFAIHTHRISSSSSSITTGVPPLSAIAATLEAIWLSHWTFVFNDTPFTSASTITILITKVRQTRRQSFLLKGLPHIAAD